MKFKSLGMIRIKRPAITDMIGEIWATVSVMKVSPLVGASNRGAAPYHSPPPVPRQQTLSASRGSAPFSKIHLKQPLSQSFFWGTMLRAMNWIALHAGCAPECSP
jgi:hypothetical protein